MKKLVRQLIREEVKLQLNEIEIEPWEYAVYKAVDLLNKAESELNRFHSKANIKRAIDTIKKTIKILD